MPFILFSIQKAPKRALFVFFLRFDFASSFCDTPGEFFGVFSEPTFNDYSERSCEMRQQCELWPDIAPQIRLGCIATPSICCLFSERCGEVVEIKHDGYEDGPVGVLFKGQEDFVFSWGQKDVVIRFQPDELIILSDWPIKEQAEALFGKYGFHSYHEIKAGAPRDDDLCWMKGCTERHAESWTLVNYWGTAIPISCCFQHRALLHGMRVEGLDLKSK